MVAAGLPLWSPGGTQGWGPVSTPRSSLPFRLQLTKALACCRSPLSWPSESTGLPSLHSVRWPRAEPEPMSRTARHGLWPLGPPAAWAGEEGRVSCLWLSYPPAPHLRPLGDCLLSGAPGTWLETQARRARTSSSGAAGWALHLCAATRWGAPAACGLRTLTRAGPGGGCAQDPLPLCLRMVRAHVGAAAHPPAPRA